MADKKILVIDDEQDERTYMSTLLEDNGYIVETACDGNEGLEKARRIKPDLITLDVAMPEKSGVRFFREMKEDEKWKKIPIIIITGMAQEFEQFISSRRSVPPPDGYLPKPIDQQEFLQKVRELTS